MRHAEGRRDERESVYMFLVHSRQSMLRTHLSEVELGVLWLLNTFDLEKSGAWVRVMLTTLVAGDASLYV
jgi:nicotinamide mononucleotide adenylyltransferase